MAFEKTRKRLAEAVKRARLKKAYKKEGMEKKAAKTKAKVKAKDPATGKVRRGAKGVKSTKGGEYVKYSKKSKAAKSFREAFAKAEGKDFTWDGRSYSTARADDKKKVAPKVDPKKVTPSGPESPVGKKEYEAKPGQKSTMQRNKPKYAEGGKVESNPYGWPSRDARSGFGKKK